MNIMTEEQPQIRINPEEIEVEAEKAAAAAATAGEAFDLEAAARDEGKEADAGEAADNSSVEVSSSSTKKCNRRSGVIIGSSILLLVAVAALLGGGYSLQRSRNQISTAMMESSALDCKDDKCDGKSTCSSGEVGLYVEEKEVRKELEDWKREFGKYVPLFNAAMLDAIMTELVFESAYVALGLACRENVIFDDVGVALGYTGFLFNVIRKDNKIDLKVDKATKKLVKDVNELGGREEEDLEEGGGEGDEDVVDVEEGEEVEEVEEEVEDEEVVEEGLRLIWKRKPRNIFNTPLKMRSRV